MFAPPIIRRLSGISAALIVVAILMLGFTPASPGASRPQHYTVRSGDSLWSIAASHYPNSDPRAAVYTIEHANHLGAAGLVAGERILLP
jgi:nucleoid-associated protein YgaU